MVPIIMVMTMIMMMMMNYLNQMINCQGAGKCVKLRRYVLAKGVIHVEPEEHSHDHDCNV